MRCSAQVCSAAITLTALSCVRSATPGALAPDHSQCAATSAAAPEIRDTLQSYVNSGTIAGAVVLAAKDGCITVFEAVGFQDLETKTPMRGNTIFQARSITKTITAAAVMQLVDEGRLRLDDPVAKYISEAASMQVATMRGSETTLSPPTRQIAIRDLLTHMSGLPEEVPQNVSARFPAPASLRDAAAIIANAPLTSQPGSRYAYSNIGYFLLGRTIEVASGIPYQTFLEQRIFAPLGMHDSFVMVRGDARGRIASAYEKRDGKLHKSGYYDFAGMHWLTFPRPSWSLFSTAADLLAFFEMLRNGGTHGGKRILAAESVARMTSVHVRDLGPRRPGFYGYGFGLYITHSPQDADHPQTAGSYGHGGLLGTRAWVDPEWRMVRIFLIQRVPLSAETAFRGEERNVFMTLVRPQE